MAKTTDRLSFWQSLEWFTLTRGKDGKVIEKSAGRKRPQGATFIRGGRKAAMAEAQRLWPDAQLPGAKPTKPVEDDEAGGEVETGTVQELEPGEKAPAIMAKPARISKSLGTLSGSPYVRISPRTPRLS